MTIKTKKSGFTIAEALMALLVISLITIASIPVITKKKRVVGTAVHGKWACTIDPASGQHMVFGSEQNPYGWIVSGNQCYFNPPRDARNFAVSAVGAGGGGAGSSLSSTAIEYTTSSTLDVEKYGKYKIVAIGAGGEGGMWNCTAKNNKNAGGGGAGGFGYAEFDIGEDTSMIDISIGTINSGGQGHRERDGKSGNSTVITKFYGTTQSQKLLTANGGGGGSGRSSTCKGDPGTGGSAGSVEYGSSYKTKKTYGSASGATNCSGNGCGGSINSDDINTVKGKFNNLLKNISTGYGKGGGTAKRKNNEGLPGGVNGTNGYAAIMIEDKYIGEGGKISPNDIKRREFYPSLKRLSVVIGKGGEGGSAGAAGSKGGTTYFGDMFSLEGGEGGKIKNLETSNSTNNYAGGNGEVGKLSLKGITKTTALGGMASGNTSSANGQVATFYGSGGGGAGLKGSTSGKGGDGAPGYVLIEW